MSKLDDVADSLLQGMAWKEEEQSKNKILKLGVDASETSEGTKSPTDALVDSFAKVLIDLTSRPLKQPQRE